MTETRDEDRKVTKKRVSTLQDTRIAPGSIWLSRLEGYAAMNKIRSYKQDIVSLSPLQETKRDQQFLTVT